MKTTKSCALAFPALVVMLATTSSAFVESVRPPLPNLDNRVTGVQAGVGPSSERLVAADKLRSRLPEARVDFDTVTGAPKLVSAGETFLSDANGAGKAISAETASTFAVEDPHRATKAFLREHSTLFGHGPEALESARIVREFNTPHSGLRTVVWEQQVEGVAVFEAVLISHTTRKGELVNLSSQLLPDATRAADRGVPNRSAQLAAPAVSAREAAAIAARNLGEDAQADGIIPAEPDSQGAARGGPEQRQEFTGEALMGTASAKLAWLPRGRDILALCWDVVLTSRSHPEMYRILVDVRNGEVLLRRCLTDYLSDATYRVYTSDSPSPFSPGHSTPSSTQPPEVSRLLLTSSALSTNASPNGWIDDGVNETRGNNVDAHTDWNNNNQPDLPRPQGSPFRVFDFTLDLTQSPTTYSDAAVVQLFYWNNFMHDKLYELGFTEAAGNFQGTNFGRGGLGNDAVQADAQDGGGYNNANFSTPPDGSPGRMQMYVFTGPTPDRDGDLDAEVILHEYTHGLSNRRVGGGVGLSALQSRGMGEGWSDFYPMALLSEAGDDVNGVYASGGYLTYQLGGLTQNYYYGIRRYPYSTDLSKNPLTFKDIDPAQASSHPGVPRSPIIGSTANEVHNMGEVWCVTLWEARANLIAKHGWATGNQLILQLVTDGMNLSPANPNFLQARDAILQADQVANAGANRAELWAAFAKRGMGYGATSPSSSTTVDLHEAYDVPDALVIFPTLLSASGPVGGPFTPNPAWFTLTNNGSNALSWKLANTSVWVTVAPTGGTLEVGMATNVAVTATPAANSFAPGIYSASFWFTNQTSGVVQPATFALAVVGRHMFDDFDPGLDLSQWSSLGGTVGSTVLANNYGGSVSAPNSFWFGDGGSRYATTLPINTTGGGFITFSLRLASGSAWPWELVDLPGEGVVLECSTNGGTSWTVVGTYSTMAYYDWTAVTLSIPPVAQAPAALFRWRQLSHNGASFDHWALDDVFVLAEDMAPLISTQPQSQTVPAGDPLTLNVAAFGTQPLGYQWLLNGTNLDGATASSLAWTSVQLTDAGRYSVFVSNRIGTAMSSNAVLTAYVPACAPPDSGLISWWAAEGDAADQVGTNSGVLQGGASFAMGRVGQAFNFNGTNQYLHVPNNSSLNPTTSISVEAWIYPRSPLNAVAAPIVKKAGEGSATQDGYALELYGVNAVRFLVYLNGGRGWTPSASAPLATGQWTHVAGVYDGTNLLFYLNGVAVGAPVVAPGQIVPSGNSLQIGHDPSTSSRYFNGLIDEAGIYGTALSPAQVQAIYLAANVGKCRAQGPPTIRSQLQSQTVAVGSNAAFSVAAGGTPPLRYQWRFNGTNLPAGTSFTLVLPNVQPANSGVYEVVVTNLYGLTNSDPATLTVLTPPQITAQPQDQMVKVGSNVLFTVTATGSDPLTYQWSFNGTVLGGRTDPILVLSNATLSQSGGYNVSVSNPVGRVSSRMAILTILGDGPCAPPPGGLVGWWAAEGNTLDSAGANHGALQGGAGFASGSVGQAFSFDGTSGSVLVPDATSLRLTNLLTIEGWINTRSTNTDRAIASKVGGAGGNNGYQFLLSGNQLVGQFNSPGLGWPSFRVQRAVPVSTGVWYHVAWTYDQSAMKLYWNGIPVATNVIGAQVIASSISSLRVGNDDNANTPFDGLIDEASVYSRSLSGAEISAIYNAGISGKCQTLASPTITTPPQGQTVAAGSSTSFSVAAAGSPPLSYQWRFNGTNIPAATGFVLTLANVQLADAGSYDVVVTNSYGATNSAPATLTVLLPPQITGQPQDQTVGIGSNVAFSVTATGSGPLSYQWYFNGAGLNGATDTSLVLSGVTLSQAGGYTVLVSNLVGSVASRNAILVVKGPGSCASPPPGLVSWWRAESDATDAAGRNHGTLQGGAPFALGKVGQAFNLNGTSQYVVVPNNSSLNPTTSISVEAWIYPRSPLNAVAAPIVKKAGEGSATQDGYALELYGVNAVRFLVYLNGGRGWTPSASAPLATGQWTHVAGVYDGTNLLFYLNGVAVGAPVVAPGQIVPSGNNLQIGHDPSSSSRYFSGLIDEAAVYSRGLSASEIAAIHGAGSVGKCGLAPAILAAPQSQTVECSSNASFSVTATGMSPLVYRWYFGSSLIPDATTSVLALANVGLGQAGSYSVVLTNAYGSVTGGPAVLTVVDTLPPIITACAPDRTLSAVAECVALLPDLTGEVVASDASGLVVVSQSPPAGTRLDLGITNVSFNARDSSGNSASCSCTIAVADLTPPTVLDCVSSVVLEFDAFCHALLPDLTGTNHITALDNCSAVTVAQTPPASTDMSLGTNTVLLTVSDNASNQVTRMVTVVVPSVPRISLQPTNLSVVLTSNAIFSVTACGAPPLAYQWQHASTNLSAATNAILTLSNIKTNDAGDYRVIILNPDGSITSAVATLTVLRPPVITRQPKSLAAAPGGSSSFSVSAQGRTPIGYQWQKNGSQLVDQTKATLDIANVQALDFATYTVAVTNADGASLSQAAMLTLAVSPVIASVGYNLETFMLTVPTEVGPTYVVEYRDCLDDALWNVLTTVAGTGSAIPITDNRLTSTARFYRVRVR